MTLAPTAAIPSLSSPFPFPAAWTWFFDELVPTHVKKMYSPRESWRDKPFSAEDGRFFFRGVEELSALFTDDRPTRGASKTRGMPDYFSHEKFRSAYLLYFMPLQASKFISLFHAHSAAIAAALESGRKSGVLRVADLGAGPGTASAALCLYLLSLPPQTLPARIEFHWRDTNAKIMADGEALLRELSERFPTFRDRISVQTQTLPWWETPRGESTRFALVLMGNVLNEAIGQPELAAKRITGILAQSAGAGVLLLEPAARASSQLLSRIRNFLLENEVIENDATSFWGPCLHAGACPLAESRDWCHFSVPVQIPGQWFKKFSQGLGSERQWAKFSYLWLSSNEVRAPLPKASLRRVVSDPIRKTPKSPGFVLLSEPEEVGRYSVGPSGPGQKIFRGALVDLAPEKEARRHQKPRRQRAN